MYFLPLKSTCMGGSDGKFYLMCTLSQWYKNKQDIWFATLKYITHLLWTLNSFLISSILYIRQGYKLFYDFYTCPLRVFNIQYKHFYDMASSISGCYWISPQSTYEALSGSNIISIKVQTSDLIIQVNKPFFILY